MTVRRTVCVDFDGVLADYSQGWQGIGHIGKPIPGAAEFTQELGRFANVLIFTTRCKSDVGDRKDADVEELKENIKRWLDRYHFWYDDIYVGQGKPIASAYVDDRAVCCEPQIYKNAFDTALSRVSYLCKEPPKDKLK